VAGLRDLDGYLTRIGLGRGASLREIHRAHTTSIAFENFDSYGGTPVSLDIGRLESKIVAGGRGGYCFEHNLLFAAALGSLGVDDVTPMLARVRLGPPAEPRPLNHLLLKVTAEGRTWLADVGFGGGGLLDPLPFETGTETDQSGWTYRLVEERIADPAAGGDEVVLQVHQDGRWVDMYGFEPRPARMVDVEVNNWYTATHPDSGFVKGLHAGARRPERCSSLFVFEQAVLVERPVGGASTIVEVGIQEVPQLLAERFGIPGVSIAESGKLVLAGSPH
jgi:N-hydroxyarylamine O-acetyltransferase